jgi:hypothetical protein
MDLRLQGGYENDFAAMEISLTAVSGAQVTGHVSLSIPGRTLEIRCPCSFLGCDLVRFTEELQRVHDAVSGTARFINSSETTVLYFDYFKRGQVFVRLCLTMPACIEERGTSPGIEETPPGIQVSFAGLCIDQTYIPEILAGVRKFIHDQALDISSPWA